MATGKEASRLQVIHMLKCFFNWLFWRRRVPQIVYVLFQIVVGLASPFEIINLVLNHMGLVFLARGPS